MSKGSKKKSHKTQERIFNQLFKVEPPKPIPKNPESIKCENCLYFPKLKSGIFGVCRLTRKRKSVFDTCEQFKNRQEWIKEQLANETDSNQTGAHNE